MNQRTTWSDDPQQCPGQATAAEIAETMRKCWWSTCQRSAWFIDWAGWKWCPYHLWYTLRESPHKARELRYLRLYWRKR